ncbi:MAG: GntR family transcriptional regulator [Microscillaceae bacterium]|nr:GntR family transcriptional regulator [Microscillaceae bacterium]
MYHAQEILQIIQIDEFSVTPKYLQLSNAIIRGIERGIIRKGDLLPSINEISFEYDISRVTVERGYNYLKNKGILGSVPGKGYFVKNTDYAQNLKIFLLFNKLSTHKKIIYDAFVETLDGQASIDFYIYNNDFRLFKKLIEERREEYTHYIIIPHFIEGGDNAHEIIHSLPQDGLILLGKKPAQVKGDFGAVYENFEQDIYKTLLEARLALSKYQALNIIFPENSYHPQEIIRGFTRFCRELDFNFRIVPSIAEEELRKNEVYINLMEDDLVILLEKVIARNFTLGQHIGVISYNETPLKRILLNGITTISTDFRQMGRSCAELILNKQRLHIENPFYLTLRASL